MSSSSPLTRSIFLSVSFFLSVRRSVLSYSFYIDLWRCFVGCFPSVCPIIIINWLSNSLPYYYYHYSYFFLQKKNIRFDLISSILNFTGPSSPAPRPAPPPHPIHPHIHTNDETILIIETFRQLDVSRAFTSKKRTKQTNKKILK